MGAGVIMSLDAVLKKARAEEPLTHSDLTRALSPADQAEREAIRAVARELRGRYTGDKVFTYGFVYLSTYCRNDCRFCPWRKTSAQAQHYRKSPEEVVAAARRLASCGVNLIDLTMGEDPAADEPDYINETADLVRAVRAAVGLPIMISPGVASDQALRQYREAGADWYACYQETHNPELFTRLRQGQDYQLRWRSKVKARQMGLLLEDGALCGVGESAGDLAASILAMKELGARQVRAMGFVPPDEASQSQDGSWVPSPAQGQAQAREVDMIAALRLAMPDRLIPASLDVEGLAGLTPRLAAGANLITSLIPADSKLAGVAQASLDIDNEARSVRGVLPGVAQEGLRLANNDEYRAWLKEAMERQLSQLSGDQLQSGRPSAEHGPIGGPAARS